MADRASLAFEEHNSACERATQSDCKCFCNGAGHQHDLILRAATCEADDAIVKRLQLDLLDVYGGFHSDERDVITATRRRDKILDPLDVKSVNLDRGRGATWLETLLLDEALHAVFLHVAAASRLLPQAQRVRRGSYVDRLTLGAIRMVGAGIDVHNVVESHVWCSIIAAFLLEESLEASEAPEMSETSESSEAPAPTLHAAICYPREWRRRIPSRVEGIGPAGLELVRSVVSSNADEMTASEKRELLRLIGAATCPDPWHHPSVVKACILPFVTQASWPPSESTKIAVMPRFGELEKRWTRRGHW